jgi:hypothetical protein
MAKRGNIALAVQITVPNNNRNENPEAKAKATQQSIPRKQYKQRKQRKHKPNGDKAKRTSPLAYHSLSES